MTRKRYNIVVTIQRGSHASYTYNHNREPVRPGKVAEVFSDAIADVMSNVTRGGVHTLNGYYYGDDIYIGISGGVTVQVVRVRA